MSASRSVKKHAPVASRSRIASCARPEGASFGGGGGPSSAHVLAEVERHLARAAAQRPRPDPHELAGGAQHVHPRRRVGADAAREHVALPHLGGQREPLQPDQRLAQPVGPGAGGRVAVDALPVRQEARERALVGRLDLLAQRGERGAPQPPQHLGVAPLALRPAGAELAAHQVARDLERLQHRREVDAVALAQRVGLERAVRAREPPHEPLHRVRHVLGEGLRQPGGRHRAERVAEQAGVLGRRPAPLAADANGHRAPLVLELLQPFKGGGAGGNTQSGLVGRQLAHPPQDIVQRVHRFRAGSFRDALQIRLDLLQRALVDQLAQLLLAEQLAQQLAVERQRRRAPLRVRLVALVHVGRDVVEQQRGGERRGRRRLHLDHAELARVQLAQQVGQARAGRARRAGTRGRSRARSGTARSAWRPRAASATSAAAATAACGAPGRRAGSAAPGPRSRGSARRTGLSHPAPRPPGPRARPGRSARAPRRAARRRRGGGR